MILEIILGTLVVTLSFTTINQMRKVERLETWVEDFSQRVIDTKATLDVIDSEGSFEADDEIGTVFQGIKDTVNELTDITNQEI
jgi:hypothetical protein|tara:strand:- start:321 stop:572 length:252 start_codon:yes stop_codon:yes gene_type:complete